MVKGLWIVKIAGSLVSIHGEGLEHDPCADCPIEADWLCDYPVGNDKTCDRKLCDDHAFLISNEIHYCSHHFKEFERFLESHQQKEILEKIIALPKKLRKPVSG